MSNLLKVLEYFKIEYDEKILCPFHGDVNPSLQINLDEDFWYCYGCQKGGDAFRFFKEMKMLDDNCNENDLQLMSKYNRIIKGEKNKSEVKEIKNVKKKNSSYYRQQLIEAKDYYNGLSKVDWIFEDNEAVDYMSYRGFNMTTLNKFGAKITYNENYPIIFPIKDNKKFKGWVCRTFDPYIANKRKYLYNQGFRRKTTLVGDYKNTKTVMLVEGYFDMLKAKQLGVKNVVAILGWKITDNQILKLKSEGVKNIISALDNDVYGKRGTKYLKNFFNVEIFPYQKDVKDMGDMDRKKMNLAKSKLKRRKSHGDHRKY